MSIEEDQAREQGESDAAFKERIITVKDMPEQFLDYDDYRKDSWTRIDEQDRKLSRKMNRNFH